MFLRTVTNITKRLYFPTERGKCAIFDMESCHCSKAEFGFSGLALEFLCQHSRLD